MIHHNSKISGWGRYPISSSEIYIPKSYHELSEFISKGFAVIPRGMGRSYGDSSLSKNVIDFSSFDNFIRFDESTGIIKCQAGVSLHDIIRLVLPQGWFPIVTPGTQYVSVGGAIASDVHGKNHHCQGSFCDHVIEISLMLATGEIVICNTEVNPDFYHATCGGMGLTGIIIDATFQLMSIDSSYISQTTYRSRSIDDAMDVMESHGDSTYSVAWLDCMVSGSSLGRALVMTGEHTSVGKLKLFDRSRFKIPELKTGVLMNSENIRIFNTMYYHAWKKKHASINYESFFYPLDAIHRWNRLYGCKGFLQYQFVLPEEASRAGLKCILMKIYSSGRGSFLSVLKKMGKQNDNILSFPKEGYTLALDFKMDRSLLGFLSELDEMVIDYDGKVYLTKDARLSSNNFRRMYPDWGKMREIRERSGAVDVFKSLQSERLDL